MGRVVDGDLLEEAIMNYLKSNETPTGGDIQVASLMAVRSALQGILIGLLKGDFDYKLG